MSRHPVMLPAGREHLTDAKEDVESVCIFSCGVRPFTRVWLKTV